MVLQAREQPASLFVYFWLDVGGVAVAVGGGWRGRGGGYDDE